MQNVLLNTNLEAKFIKDTIINSLNEEEFLIDIENYSKNHLRDFETQINDIKIWFKENRKGQIVVRIQGEKLKLLPFNSGENYFIIIADETSGMETYGGGRFMYASPDSLGNAILDFNKAYTLS